ncbi:hypothetical protein TKK_0017815 [Trichogramma kaykai]
MSRVSDSEGQSSDEVDEQLHVEDDVEDEDETGEDEADEDEADEDEADEVSEDDEPVKKKRTRKTGRKNVVPEDKKEVVSPYFFHGYFNTYPLRAFRVAVALRQQLGPYDFASPIVINCLSNMAMRVIAYGYTKGLPEPSVRELPAKIVDGDKILRKNRKDLNALKRNSTLTLLNLVTDMYIPWISVSLLSTTYTIVHMLYKWKTSIVCEDTDPEQAAVMKAAWKKLLIAEELTFDDINLLVHVLVFRKADKGYLPDDASLERFKYPRRLTNKEVTRLRSQFGGVACRAELMAIASYPAFYGLHDKLDRETAMFQFCTLAYQNPWNRPFIAPERAQVFQGPVKEHPRHNMAANLHGRPIIPPTKRTKRQREAADVNIVVSDENDLEVPFPDEINDAGDGSDTENLVIREEIKTTGKSSKASRAKATVKSIPKADKKANLPLKKRPRRCMSTSTPRADDPASPVLPVAADDREGKVVETPKRTIRMLSDLKLAGDRKILIAARSAKPSSSKKPALKRGVTNTLSPSAKNNVPAADPSLENLEEFSPQKNVSPVNVSNRPGRAASTPRKSPAPGSDRKRKNQGSKNHQPDKETHQKSRRIEKRNTEDKRQREDERQRELKRQREDERQSQDERQRELERQSQDERQRKDERQRELERQRQDERQRELERQRQDERQKKDFDDDDKMDESDEDKDKSDEEKDESDEEKDESDEKKDEGDEENDESDEKKDESDEEKDESDEEKDESDDDNDMESENSSDTETSEGHRREEQRREEVRREREWRLRDEELHEEERERNNRRINDVQRRDGPRDRRNLPVLQIGEDPLQICRIPGNGRILICEDFNVWIDRAFLTVVNRWKGNPKEMTRRLLKKIVGAENLKRMCARGRSTRYEPIPEDIISVVEYYVNRRCSPGLTPAEFTTAINMMCATLRNPRQ